MAFHGQGHAFKYKMLTPHDSVDEDDVDEQCDALRKKLQGEQSSKKDTTNARGLKSHQVHELAKAKIEESEKLRRALGIRDDYEEGSHWRRQEEKTKEGQRKGLDEERERERKRAQSEHSD